MATTEEPLSVLATPGVYYSHLDGDGRGEHGTNQANGKSEDPVNKGLNTSQGQESCPSNITRGPRNRSKPGNDSILSLMCQWTVDHQIGLSANLLLLLAMTHMSFPRARRNTTKFFQLSYYNNATGKYTLGWDDVFLVFYWIVVFTGLRAAVMDYVLVPIAQMAGIRKRKEKVRFAEQAWIFLYSTAFWSLGMYLMYNSGYWFNYHELWVGWPNRELDGLFKWYYLVQFAFWLQQIVVVNIEERRKDYYEMFIHHIITSVLLFTSYGYHQAKVGNTILCLMDVADIFLPLAKMLKYLRYQMACDIAFGLFILVWVIGRHLLYPRLCWSLYADSPEIMNYGCFWGPTSDLHGPIDPPDRFSHLIQPFRDPEGIVCWNDTIKWSFMFALLALQVVLLLWFYMIVQVALRVLRGGQAEDSRSDDEGENEEDDHIQQTKIQTDSFLEEPPLEEEVGVEDMNLGNRKTSPNKRFRKGGGAASGVTLHSDRKELLGRIGCDKAS